MSSRNRTAAGVFGGLSIIFLAATILSADVALGGETLYNGIELPDQWPPRSDGLKREPMPVPYLASPPKVIPVDVGRQLLVDDFLIDKSDLKRTFHRPTLHKDNPILKAD